MVFVGAEFGEAHRAAGVEAVGADANFGTESEFEAVVEAGGRVPKNRGAVDFGEEAAGGGFVGGDDRVAVGGAVAVDERDGLIDGIDDADGDDVVEELGAEIGLRRRRDGG